MYYLHCTFVYISPSSSSLVKKSRQIILPLVKVNKKSVYQCIKSSVLQFVLKWYYYILENI